MKKMHTPVVAILLAGAAITVTLPVPVRAQMTDYAAGTSVIMASGSRAAQVRNLKSVPSVGVVRLDRLRLFSHSGRLPDRSEYQLSAAKNAAGIAKLRSALSANPVTRAALRDRGVDIGRIVGVKVGSNGSLRVYIL